MTSLATLIDVIDYELDCIRDRDSETRRLIRQVQVAHTVGMVKDPDRGMDRLREICPPDDGQPHSLELIARYVFGARLLEMKIKTMNREVADLPTDLDAAELGVLKIEQGDRSGAANVADCFKAHAVELECLTMNVQRLSFLQAAAELAHGDDSVSKKIRRGLREYLERSE